MQTLAAIAPTTAYASLSKPDKAAIIVQLLIDEEIDFSLVGMPDKMQATLTRDLSKMPLVDRGTLEMVVAEFIAEVENLGLAPNSLEHTLRALEGKISASTLARLKRERGIRSTGDPWTRIGEANAETLAPILQLESVEVAAVVISKIPVTLAASIMEHIPGAQARQIAYAVSQTSAISHAAVDRIGQTLLGQLDQRPDNAFEDGPVDRVGAILNSTTATTRDNVLEGLDETDASFASEVRKAIFTFANIPERLAPRDVPKVIKDVDGDDLLQALVAAKSLGEEVALNFLLENMSQRMADQIREGMEEIEAPSPEEAEAKLSLVTEVVRDLEARGEITLLAGD